MSGSTVEEFVQAFALVLNAVLAAVVAVAFLNRAVRGVFRAGEGR